MIVSNEYFEIIELLYGKLWTSFDSFSSLALVNVQQSSLQISGPSKHALLKLDRYGNTIVRTPFFEIVVQSFKAIVVTSISPKILSIESLIIPAMGTIGCMQTE